LTKPNRAVANTRRSPHFSDRCDPGATSRGRRVRVSSSWSSPTKAVIRLRFRAVRAVSAGCGEITTRDHIFLIRREHLQRRFPSWQAHWQTAWWRVSVQLSAALRPPYAHAPAQHCVSQCAPAFAVFDVESLTTRSPLAGRASGQGTRERKACVHERERWRGCPRMRGYV
jgi:hypothetical protein